MHTEYGPHKCADKTVVPQMRTESFRDPCHDEHVTVGATTVRVLRLLTGGQPVRPGKGVVSGVMPARRRQRVARTAASE